MPTRFAPLVIAAALLAPAALAQDVRPASRARSGGTYSPACTDPAAPRVRIAANGLTIARGARSLHTTVHADSHTSFGAAPTAAAPEGYRVEFLGDAYSLYVFEDSRGLHVPLAAYTPAAIGLLGKAGVKARFGKCTTR